MKIASMFISVFFIVSSCASSPYRKTLLSEEIENPYVSFYAPTKDWFVHKKIKLRKHNKKANLGIHTQLNKTTYNVTLASYPYKWMPITILFDKNSDYEAQFKSDSNLFFIKNRKAEQGIHYTRTWITYVQGMKCNGAVFSRSRGGLLKEISSKNYSIACGYYHKTEGKRILLVSYRYSYGGGHSQNKASAKNKTSLSRSENYLKRSVAQLIKSIKIKDIDWQKMKTEGLLHPNTSLDMSVF